MRKTMVKTIAAGVAGLIGTALGAQATAMFAAGQTAPVQSSTPDPQAVANLIAAIETQLASVPTDGSIDAYQGAIAFAVDQAQAPANVVLAALQALQRARPNASRALTAALGSMIGNYQSLAGTSGTGGTTANAAPVTQQSVTSQGVAPALSTGPTVSGGGSNNYSRPTS
ncbi:hypothetical protein [Sphingomonas sp.]|uniref:hypothetical protein n=1 Tax=Sphingomonas sp. TaxID=28214 RepID=UPI0031D9C096